MAGCFPKLAWSQKMGQEPVTERLLRKAENCRTKQETDSAIHFYQQAIQQLEQKNIYNSISYTKALLALGQIHLDEFQLSEAERCLTKAFQASSKMAGKNTELELDVIEGMGDLHAVKGEFKKASQYYRQFATRLKLLRGESDISYARALQSLSQMLLENGDFQEAEQRMLTVESLYQKKNDPTHTDLASNLNDIGLLYSHMGEFDLAERYYEKALSAYEKGTNPDPLDRAMVLSNLGDLQEEMGNYLGAKPYYQEVFALRHQHLKHSHPDYARALILIGNLAWYEKKKDSAIIYYEEAKVIFKQALGELHPDYGIALFNLAQLNAEQKNYTIAERYYQQSLSIRSRSYGEDHPAYITCLVRLANFYRKIGNDSMAISYYTEAHNKKVKALTGEFSWLSSMGRAAYWEQEIDFYRSVNTYGAKIGKEYPHFLGLIYQSNAMAKSILMESDRELESRIKSSKDATLKNNFLSIKALRRKEIRHFLENTVDDKKIEQIRLKTDSLDKAMARRLDRFSQDSGNPPINWQNIKDNLNEGEAAIEFIRYLDDEEKAYKYMALIVHPRSTHPDMVKLGREDKIRIAIKDRNFASLYPLVWQGIDTLMSNIRTIYYSTDGELNILALHAICTETSGVSNSTISGSSRGFSVDSDSSQIGTCQNYLLDRYELHQLTSTRYLAEKSFRDTSRIHKSICLIGDVNYDTLPNKKSVTKIKHSTEKSHSSFMNSNESIKRTYSNEKMAALPGTKKEVQKIQEILRSAQWKTTLRVGTSADEGGLTKIIQTNPTGILHIATHGFSFPSRVKKNGETSVNMYGQYADPMLRSGLMLSGSNISWTGDPEHLVENSGEDGILTAAEVSTLNLSNTELVVLSACETGLGKIDGWEGTYGLKRGFKLAGADKLIVSLWPVPDKETAELMTFFYSDLATSGNIVKAFHKAQQHMRNKYPQQPALWAGFVLIR